MPLWVSVASTAILTPSSAVTRPSSAVCAPSTVPNRVPTAAASAALPLWVSVASTAILTPSSAVTRPSSAPSRVPTAAALSCADAALLAASLALFAALVTDCAISLLISSTQSIGVSGSGGVRLRSTHTIAVTDLASTSFSTARISIWPSPSMPVSCAVGSHVNMPLLSMLVTRIYGFSATLRLSMAVIVACGHSTKKLEQSISIFIAWFSPCRPIGMLIGRLSTRYICHSTHLLNLLAGAIRRTLILSSRHTPLAPSPAVPIRSIFPPS